MLNPNNKMILFVGPSGVGKTTLRLRLQADVDLSPGFEYPVSVTTRKRRPEEVRGKEYFFWSQGRFKKSILNGLFVEYSEVHGNSYGTLWSEIQRIWNSGKVPTYDSDVYGLRALGQVIPGGILSVFVFPPSLRELELRLRARKTESEKDLGVRLQNAAGEMKEASMCDFLLVNDDLDVAYALLKKRVQKFVAS